jgi:NitT/TauT family transport system substrate-binding protein
MQMMRIPALSMALVAASATLAAAGAAEKVKFAVNPGQVIYLPLLLAVDKGYFRGAGLEVQIIPYKGSANTQMPLLARGDIDISSVVAGPAMFNQQAEGFNIKLIAALTEPRKGYQDGVVLVVRKDLWDSGAIRQAADLKGHKVDGAAEGNPIDFLLKQTLAGAGIKRSDVQLSYKVRTPADFPEVLRQKLVDVAGISEPTASYAVAQGLGVKFLSYQDVVPWFQETYLSASEQFLRDRPEAATRFLATYLRAAREVDRSGGAWTPETLAVAVKWTGMPEALLLGIGGIPYWGETAAIRLDALARVQQFWQDEGLVTTPADLGKLVDSVTLEQALKRAAGN